MLEHRIPELTRKARTHRLCTRGGMLESFLICPGELTDDQVMELLQLSFRQQEVVLALAKMIHDLQAVSYTHLDVYKRQAASSIGPPTAHRSSALRTARE